MVAEARDFPKASRLRKRSEYLRVQASQTKLSSGSLLALVLENHRDDQSTRAGFTVSSKVGNAVTRNRIRRHLREAYRHCRSGLPRGLDIVLIARQSAARAPPQALTSAVSEIAAAIRRRFPPSAP